MKLFKEILPQEQQEIYDNLKQVTELNFTLFGGTAIALQLGHRKSVDFDFFTPNDIKNLKETLINLKGIQFDIRIDDGSNDNTLSYITKNRVKISFFGNMDFVNLSKTIDTDDGILKLADLNSLLITKLKATCDRSEYKDYIDIYTILKQGNEVERLSEAIIKFPNFFGRDFPSINLLKNLTYFEDGDLNRLTKKEKAFLVNTVEKVDANKIIEAQRRELQLKAIEQLKADKKRIILSKSTDKER